jgi:peptidoglycan/xylan/chitin deacetylase (PgdA/CDA1 family)
VPVTGPCIVNPRKLLVAAALDRLGVTRGLIAAQQRLFRRSIRIVYYHDVPPSAAGHFNRQLQMLRRHYVPAGPAELSALLATGHWPHPRPGIIVSFDDGLRSHAEVAAPLLEAHGMTGWFFVPTDLVLLEPAEQPAAAKRAAVLHACDTARDPRVFLTVAEVRSLATRHVVGCHTDTHVRLRESLDAAALQREIPIAQALLAQLAGRPVDSFAWVGGEEPAYGRAAARQVAACFRLAFTTNSRLVRAGQSPLALNRTHLEADFPESLVRLQLSGLMDLLYHAKRRRLATVLGASGSGPADPGVTTDEVLQG